MILDSNLLLLKEVSNARQGESDLQPNILKTLAPHCQPTERRERKNSRRRKGSSSSIGPTLETRQSHTIEYSGQQDRFTMKLREE